MTRRHPRNTNLKLHHEATWNGFPVQTQRGPLAIPYLESILDTMNYTVREYPRVCAIRFDLRFPANGPEPDTAVISRFFASLIAQLEADSMRKQREGKRVYPCRLRYVWAREQADGDRAHYHVVILVNRDAYFTLGQFQSGVEDGDINMFGRLNKALASALGCAVEQVAGLVHVPLNPVYRIDGNHPDCVAQFVQLFYRLSYLAKVDTKDYGDHGRHFGCSRG